MGRVISIIGSVLILSVGIYLAVQPSVKTTASTFMEALAVQNYGVAYNSFSDSKKGKYGGQQQFEKFIQNNQFIPVKWSFSMKNKSDRRRDAIRGYANLQNDKVSNFRIKAKEINDEWYIDEFEFTK